jgi:hypothetical protein
VFTAIPGNRWPIDCESAADSLESDGIRANRSNTCGWMINIRFSVTFGISVPELFERNAAWNEQPNYSIGVSGQLYPIRVERSRKELQTALKKALNDSNGPPTPLYAICRRFRVAHSSVRRRFPKLAAQLISKYRQHRQTNSAARRLELQKKLEGLLKELRESGRKQSRYHLRMLMRRKSEPHIYSMLRIFSERFDPQCKDTKP